MVSQVLRWSALGVGVFYGFYHNQALKSQAQAHAAKAEWDNKESLISQAKAEWAKSHPQEQPKPSSGTSAVFLVLGSEAGGEGWDNMGLVVVEGEKKGR
jgi:F-type H+-transporting ATP synthase subunit e